MKLERILIMMLFIASPVLVSAEPLATVKQLLLMAIDAPDGKASGVLTDAVADKFRETTGSPLPVLVEVSTLKHFRQEGCRRLNLRIRQEGAGKGQFGIDYGINLCRDGSPPTEGMDLEQASKFLAPKLEGQSTKSPFD
jgi:hypothetical protein